MAKAGIEPRSARFEADTLPLDQQEDEEGGKVEGEGGTAKTTSFTDQPEIEPISTQVKRRRWRRIGHVLRQQTTALTRIALPWTPDGQRKRGRPKETWRRTVEREMKEKGWTWGRLERV